jgi:arylsulfatase A-like enzyme
VPWRRGFAVALLLIPALAPLACRRSAAFADAPVVADLAAGRSAGEGTALRPGGPSPAPEERLSIPAGERRDFYLRLPPEAAITFDGLDLPAAGGVRLRVSMRPARGEEESLATLAADRGFAAIPLTADRYRIVRLSFVAEGRRGSGGVAILTHPAIRSRLPVPGRPPGLDGGEGRPPNVIVYLVDALRAQHLGTYGYPRPTSPALDRFAAGATLFTRAFAQASWTRAAVASLFTGREPRRHGVNGRDDALGDDALTLAEVLKGAGYRTAAFVTNGNVGATFGFAQGFDRFALLGEEHSAAVHHLADEVNEAVFPWLREHGADGPFLLYVHTTDPHAPYAPREPFRSRFAPAGGALPPSSAALRGELAALRDSFGRRFPETLSLAPGSLVWMRGLAQSRIPVTPQLVDRLASLYDAEIAANDAAFGAFVDELRRLDLYDDSLILFTADHGEEFHEHGGWEHGRTLYDEVLRIPFVLKLPGQQQGSRRDDAAQQIDLLPTVAELLGLRISPGGRGRSLLGPPPGDGQAPPRSVFSYLDLDGNRLASVVDGCYRLIVRYERHPGVELYDLAADPGEEVNLVAGAPVVAEYLESRLATHRGVAVAPQVAPDALAPEIRRQLQALGYLN